MIRPLCKQFKQSAMPGPVKRHCPSAGRRQKEKRAEAPLFFPSILFLAFQSTGNRIEFPTDASASCIGQVNHILSDAFCQ